MLESLDLVHLEGKLMWYNHPIEGNLAEGWSNSYGESVVSKSILDTGIGSFQ